MRLPLLLVAGAIGGELAELREAQDARHVAARIAVLAAQPPTEPEAVAERMEAAGLGELTLPGRIQLSSSLLAAEATPCRWDTATSSVSCGLVLRLAPGLPGRDAMMGRAEALSPRCLSSGQPREVELGLRWEAGPDPGSALARITGVERCWREGGDGVRLLAPGAPLAPDPFVELGG